MRTSDRVARPDPNEASGERACLAGPGAADDGPDAADVAPQGGGDARDVAALRVWLKRTAGNGPPRDPSFEQRLRALARRARWSWQRFQWTPAGETLQALTAGLTALALAVCVVALLTTTLPGLLGFPAVVVSGGAMRPAIASGDLAFVRRGAGGGEVAVGDVVALRLTRGAGLTLRRVVAVQEVNGRPYLQTRADANAAADPDLRGPDQVAGVVAFSLPRVGWLLDVATASPVGYLLVWLPLVILAAQEARELIRAARWGVIPIGGRFEPRSLDPGSESIRLGADALRARLSGDRRRIRARLRPATRKARPA